VGAKRLNKSVLDRNLAKGIIHHFLEECSRSAKKLELTVSGGEPTTVPGLLAWLMSFTREEAEIRKIQCSSKILTNGVYNRSAEKIIIGNFDSVQISWDGDYPNNPRYGKKLKQAGVVRTNIGRLVEAGIPVSLLTVVSEHNQTELEKLADDVYQNMQADSLFLSLKDSVGRALNHQKPDYNLIGDKYFRLWKKYRVLGYDINLTGTNVHAISKYPCAVAAPNFSVSPTGRISACTIAFNDASAKSEPFGIGGAGDGIRLDQEKIGKLQIYSVEHRSGCKNCHAKWHCRGGCPYAFENGMAAGDPERCDLVRKVIADKLMWIIENE
jgi:radical SAM protein with 4Fe4S-binding SPASM domain